MKGVKADIAKTYGSLSKFAARLGINRSTLGRVLDGTYTGDIDKYRQAIKQQLAADGHEGIFAPEPEIVIDVPTVQVETINRLALTINFLKLLKHRLPDGDDIRAALNLATDELSEVEEVLRG